MTKVGTYQLGTRRVTIYLRPGFGGSVYSFASRIEIGDSDCWKETVSCLLHEAFETMTIDMRLRLTPCTQYSNATDKYTFIMDHSEFTEVCSRVGWFMTKCIPDLEKAWKKKRRKCNITGK